MEIRKAKLKDINIILRYFNLLRKYESKFDKTVKFNERLVKKKILKALADKDVAYFIAYSNKEAVGCAEVYMKNKYAVISSAFVHLSSRGKGIGAAIFGAILKLAKRKRAKALKLQVYRKNYNAIGRWKKLGFKITKSTRKFVVMNKRL